MGCNKEESGTVTLRASHDKSFLRIDIIDDGAGIDTKRVLEKVILNRLITKEEAQNLSEKQIAQFIFHPGLSTAEQLSDISGRGVGMDVVKTNIESLGGRVDLISKIGEGTHFKIFLPLNTTVKKCLITKFNDEFNAFSIDQIDETLKVKQDQISEKLGGYYFHYREKVVEIVNYSNTKDVSKLILTSVNERLLALEVDSFLGWEDLVIKRAPRLINNIQGLIGVSVLGDGCAVLVNDVMQVVASYIEVSYAA